MDSCTPLFKSNRNLFSSVKWWYSFSMYRFDNFHVAWWGLLHSLWKISWVDVIATRLCKRSNLVRFEKCVAKTLQHGYRYGDIIMLHDIITTYEWFFSAIIDTNCVLVTNNDTFSAYNIFGQILCYNFKHECALTPPLLCWYATSGAGGIGSGNQLMLGNAKQCNDMKFFNISR